MTKLKKYVCDTISEEIVNSYYHLDPLETAEEAVFESLEGELFIHVDVVIEYDTEEDSDEQGSHLVTLNENVIEFKSADYNAGGELIEMSDEMINYIITKTKR